MANLLEQLNRCLGATERVLMVLLTSGLIGILCAQVVLRYFFNSPLFWAEDVAVQLLIIISFIGTSYLIYLNKLVRVDLLVLSLPANYRNWLLRVLNLLALTTLGFLCYVATDWIMRPEIRSDVSPTTQIPRWYNYSILVFSFYCMTFHQLIKVISPEKDENNHQPTAEKADKSC